MMTRTLAAAVVVVLLAAYPSASAATKERHVVKDVIQLPVIGPVLYITLGLLGMQQQVRDYVSMREAHKKQDAMEPAGELDTPLFAVD